MFKKLSFLTVLAVIVLLGTSGCIINFNTPSSSPTAAANLGGMFVSGDKMDTWKSISALMMPSGTSGSIVNTDIYFMRIDPSDSSAIYIGTRADGLFYSYNAGAGWTQATKLPVGFVRDLVIDPVNKCQMYAAVEERIYKSVDCARTWRGVWYSGDVNNKVAALGIDWYAPRYVYAGLADGTFVKSDDSGVSWMVSKKFEQRVNKIIVDPNDSHNVYAGILNVGLFKTSDKGDNWESLNAAMKGFNLANVYYDFVLSKSVKDEIVYANQYGLLRSLDGGTTWSEIKLLTQPGAEAIYGLDIDPKNANNIYYGTATNLYKTSDGGTNWIVKRLPTTRVAGVIMVYPTDSTRIYMGAKSLQ